MTAPVNNFDGTNPILTIVGDLPTQRDVSMTNHGIVMKFEPLTNLSILAGQTVLVRIKGDVAFDQVLANIEQINLLKGFEVISVTDVLVPDWTLTNATYSGGALRYIAQGAVNGASGMYGYRQISNNQIISLVLPNSDAIDTVLCEISTKAVFGNAAADALVIHWSPLSSTFFVQGKDNQLFTPATTYAAGFVVSAAVDLINNVVNFQVHNGATLVEEFSINLETGDQINLWAQAQTNFYDEIAILEIAVAPAP